MAELLGDFQRASLIQVKTGRGGRMVNIESDVFDTAKRLHEIDRSLGVDWNDTAGYFRVTQTLQDGSKHVVLTCLELTPAVIQEVAKTVHPSYNLAAEIEKAEAQEEREFQHAQSEKIGDIGERLYSAMRKDLGVKSRIVLPRGVDA
jgi:hypothetical protein